MEAPQSEFTTESTTFKRRSRDCKLTLLQQSDRCMNVQSRQTKATEDNEETLSWTKRTTETVHCGTQPSSCTQAALEENPRSA